SDMSDVDSKRTPIRRDGMAPSQTTLANDRITNDNANVAANPEHWHPEHIPGPKEDIHRKDAAYVGIPLPCLMMSFEMRELTQKSSFLGCVREGSYRVRRGPPGGGRRDGRIARAINSVVPHEDDPSTPVTTFRSVFLGTTFGAALCFANTLMSFRTSSVIIPSTVVALVTYPCGVFLSKILPRSSFITFGHVWSLNPGPFNMKEHVIVYMIASAAGTGVPYGLDNLIAQKWMGKQDISWFEGFSWLITTQMIGFGFSGVLRRFLI
ncbi:hypothetical protein HKX48_000507, partial [Thoreauomyces humboldtii]